MTFLILVTQLSVSFITSMSKQDKKDTERTSRAKTAKPGNKSLTKRGRSRSKSRNRLNNCEHGASCEFLRSLKGCSFHHTKEELDETKSFRACKYGTRCSYVTEYSDDCEYNHGIYQRDPASASAEPEGATVEEVLDIETKSDVSKKNKTKSNKISLSASASAPPPPLLLPLPLLLPRMLLKSARNSLRSKAKSILSSSK